MFLGKLHKKQKQSPGIICFSGTDWWYHNKGLFCPQIMRRLAKHHRVLYINSLGMRVPSLRKDPHAINKILRKLKSISRLLKKVDERMYVFSPLSIPFPGSRLGSFLNLLLVRMQVKLTSLWLGLKNPVVFVGCPTALGVVEKMKKQCLIYERSDFYEEMPGTNKSYIASLDRELMRSADLVLYMNRALWSDGLRSNPSSLLIGHGVDFDLFANPLQTGQIPEDLACIPRPVIGWFGDLSVKTSDLDLVEYALKSLPKMSFVFVGPVSSDVTRLRSYSNVYFLGPKPYEQIPSYGREFDVLIMPWNQNKWIEFCCPVKTKEYLALGKPVVSVCYPELKPYLDVLYSTSTYDEFIEGIRCAVRENDPHLAQRRKEKVRNETWDNKVRMIRDFIGQKLELPF